MVVLAASVITKSGKALVSRQYVDMSRIRIEGLLAAFPKLVGSGKQHTYVETENVRYVYQPMEALYLLLVTNRGSNILEDLEVLRLLAKTVPDYVQTLSEEGIVEAAFDLLSAFDEVISLGYKENVTLQQVRQNTAMESHEEKLHKMIIQNKIAEVQEQMKVKAQAIDKARMEAQKAGRASAPYVPPSGSSSGRTDVDTTPTFLSRPQPTGFASSRPGLSGANKPGKKGMQLGKAKKTNDFLDSLRAEGEIVNSEAAPSSAGPAAAAVLPEEPVSLVVEEKLAVVLNKDGGLESMEVQGTMSLQGTLPLSVGEDVRWMVQCYRLQVLREEDAAVRIYISMGNNSGYQFKTHPKLDKSLYSQDSILGLKDPTAAFPAGSPLGVLKWRYQAKDESEVPLTINCWPSASGADSYVNIEYESNASFDLQDIVIAIPLPALASSPKVNQVDGDWQYDPRKSLLLWRIDLIDDSNKSGSMEFVVPVTRPESFFPVNVSFQASKTLCQVEVADVVNAESEQPVKYAIRTGMQTESYEVL